MGEPVIISDGSPVKITWLGANGWTVDPTGRFLTRNGGLQVEWLMFNLVDKVDVKGKLQLKINFKLDSQNSGQALLLSTDANGRNLRLEIDNLPQNQQFSNVFAPPRGGGNKFQTSGDASITGISFQLGSGQLRKKPTLKLLPTTIMLYEG